jgi:Uma2 family endonuclease
MIRAGVVTDDDPIELIEGVLVFRTPKNPPHETCAGKSQDEFPRVLPRGWHLRLQAPVTLDDGEPEPDAAVVRGLRGDYAARHPSPSDLALVIEIADTTLRRDRGVKLRSYARAGIPTYWLINLEARTVEVYTKPEPNLPEPAYANRVDLGEHDSLDVVLDGNKVGTIAVRDLLP